MNALGKLASSKVIISNNYKFKLNKTVYPTVVVTAGIVLTVRGPPLSFLEVRAVLIAPGVEDVIMIEHKEILVFIVI